MDARAHALAQLVSPAESRLGMWRAAYPAFRPKDGLHAGLSYFAPTALESSPLQCIWFQCRSRHGAGAPSQLNRNLRHIRGSDVWEIRNVASLNRAAWPRHLRKLAAIYGEPRAVAQFLQRVLYHRPQISPSPRVAARRTKKLLPFMQRAFNHVHFAQVNSQHTYLARRGKQADNPECLSQR